MSVFSGIADFFDRVVDTTLAGSNFIRVAGVAGQTPLPVAPAVTLPAYTTLQNAVAVTGNGSTLDVSGMSQVIFDIVGSFVATVSFETRQADGTTWTAFNVLQSSTGVVGPTTTSTGLFTASVGGMDTVRARVTWTSGTTITIKARAVLVSANYQPLTNPLGQIALENNTIRNAPIHHRTAVVANDCIPLPVTPTAVAVTEAGSTLAATSYHFAVAAGNIFGPTTAIVDGGAVALTLNQALRISVAQVTGATYYEIFMTTAAAPLWVGRITEAQRATGDQIISTLGVTTARAGSTVAGTIDIGCLGTGVASTQAPFTSNMALLPTNATPISFTGYQTLIMEYKVTVSDLRIIPVFNLRLLWQNPVSLEWFQFGTTSAAGGLNGATNPPLLATQSNTVWGAGNIVVLVQNISSGQGVSVDIWITQV